MLKKIKVKSIAIQKFLLKYKFYKLQFYMDPRLRAMSPIKGHGTNSIHLHPHLLLKVFELYNTF